jgi:DDE superfamily endonuclease
LKKDNDNFNFFASLLQIRIEMAFDLMTKKWGILQRPLTSSLKNINHIICCVARLHNFRIDERLKNTSMPLMTTININDSLSVSQLANMHATAQAE